LKEKEMPFAGKRMELKVSKGCEISQPEEDR
jgi:hypothetical protein